MHDIRTIRADPAAFDAAMAARPAAARSDILARDAERRAALTALQEKQARRNALAKRDRPRPPRRRRHRARWKPKPPRCAPTWRRWRRAPAALDGEHPRRARTPAQHPRRRRARRRRTRPPTSCSTSTATPRDLGFQPSQHFELGEALGLMDFDARRQARRRAASPSCAARWRGWNARSASSCSTCTPREHGYEEVVGALCWSTTPPCTAPASCRNSPTTCSAPPTAAG